jgi:macrodomain Ter protein organizer (MatP/YcbG family)
MENTNDINNPIQSQVEPEIKKKMTQAQKDCQKRYYNKIKSNPEFKSARDLMFFELFNQGCFINTNIFKN